MVTDKLSIFKRSTEVLVPTLLYHYSFDRSIEVLASILILLDLFVSDRSIEVLVSIRRYYLVSERNIEVLVLFRHPLVSYRSTQVLASILLSLLLQHNENYHQELNSV